MKGNGQLPPPVPKRQGTSKQVSPQIYKSKATRLTTFEDIDKMSPTKVYKGFKPSDILDQLSDGDASEDEILKKYATKEIPVENNKSSLKNKRML